MQTSTAREVMDDGGRWLATLSTGETDNHGDSVRVDGWRWEGATVPLLVAHEGEPVGRCRPYVEEGRLKGELIFPAAGTSTASDEARHRVERGELRSLSVRFHGVGRSNDRGGTSFRQALLTEASLVREGANPAARVESKVRQLLVLPRALTER